MWRFASILRAIAAGVALSTTVSAYAATAGREPLRIRVEPPNGCFDADQFFLEVLARTPAVRLATEGEAARTIIVDVRTRGREVEGSLRFEDDVHETRARGFQAATCGEALAAAALIAALSIDPKAHEAPTAAPDAETAAEARNPVALDGGSSDGSVAPLAPNAGLASSVQASPAPPPPSSPVPAPLTPAPARVGPTGPSLPSSFPRPSRLAPAGATVPQNVAFEPRAGWMFSVGGSVDAVLPDGFTGNLAVGPRVFIEASRRSSGLFGPTIRLGGERISGATATMPPIGSASPQWLTLDLSFCPIRVFRASLSLCGDVEGGSLQLDAIGKGTSTKVTPWGAAELLSRLKWPALAITDRLALAFDMELGLRVPLSHETFYFLNDPEKFVVYSTPAVIPHGALEVALRIW